MQDELAELFDRQMSMTQFHPTPTQEIVGSSQVPDISYGIPQPYQSPPHSVSPEQHPSINVLRHRGLDPDTLTPNQLGLFENADAEQRERLIQTWQLYSQIGCEASAPTQDFAMTDSAMDDSDENTYAEPYMVSGYENNNQVSLPKEPTTGEPYVGSKDPVYQTQEWWELTKAGPMESSYGAFEEMRRYYPSCGVYRC